MTQGATFEEAAVVMRDRMSDTAFEHSMRVAETAERLAVSYGVDPKSAKLAGALHDWDRELDASRLLDAATEAGLDVDDADRTVPYLLHARTGAAAIVRALPGVGEDVVTAVARHTVGAADMSPLDMVVYVADMIEPARDFPGVQDLRDAVGMVPLHELFALGYQHSVAHLVEMRMHIHPDTVAVWNSMVAGGAR